MFYVHADEQGNNTTASARDDFRLVPVWVEDACSSSERAWEDRLDLLLVNLAQLASGPDAEMPLNENTDWPLGHCSTPDEFRAVFYALKARGDVADGIRLERDYHLTSCWLTFPGWAQAQNLLKTERERAMVERLRESERQRFAVLTQLWEHSQDHESPLHGNDVRDSSGVNPRMWGSVLGDLLQKGLIKDHGGFLRLTPLGKDEVEAKLQGRPGPRDHFPTVQITVGGSVYGAIQAASNHSTQHVSIAQTQSTDRLLIVAKEILAALPELGIEDAEARKLRRDAITLQAQIESGEPEPTVVKQAAGSIQRVLEATLSGAAAPLLATHGPKWLQAFQQAFQHFAG